MAISKGIGGYVFHSQALLADAIHALTDLVSDIMTLATVSFSLKPPSNRFPTGFGKVESLGALGVSSLLLTGGILMGWNALEVLYGQFMLDPSAAAEHAAHGHGHGHGHSHSHADLGPNINAAWIAAGSIVVKEYLYRATIKIARERKSSVLASNAVHHRIDSSSSVVALLAIGGSKVLSNATWLDPVGGLIVSLMVVRAGYGNTTMALMELADTAVDTDIKDSVRRAATKALSPGGSDPASVVEGAAQIEIRDVQGVKAGQNYLMEVELSVPGDWSLHQTRKIEEAVRQRIGATVRGVKRVKVRFVPAGTDATEFADEFISVDVSPRTSPEPEAGPQHQHSNGLDTLSGSPTEKKDR
ncbi:MAG: hypothetical protein M1817_002733 [Caeruleum heppii]|nr:MAG: hypothetical protein M1817_002733 [Caeruleum heppii]